MRQLVNMVEAHRREAFEHTASICAAIYNSRMGVKKQHWIDASKLNPYRRKRKRKGGKLKISDFAKGWGK